MVFLRAMYNYRSIIKVHRSLRRGANGGSLPQTGAPGVANWLAEIVAACENRGYDFALSAGDKLSLAFGESQLAASRADNFFCVRSPQETLMPAESNSLFSLGDNPARDPRRRTAGGFSAHRVDYQRS